MVRPLPDGIGTHRLYAYCAPNLNHRIEKMNRKKSFDDLKKHPYYGPLIAKLPKGDLVSLESFIAAHGDYSKGDWEKATNALLMAPNRSKKVALICDILTAII